MQFMVCVVGNVHVSWMNPDDEFDTKKSAFSNQKHRNIYIGAPSL